MSNIPEPTPARQHPSDKPSSCPSWCAHDVRYDEGLPDDVLVHHGQEQTFETCGHPYTVQLQRWEYAASAEPTETHVRLDDTPLTQAQAMALGAALICESVRDGAEID